MKLKKKIIANKLVPIFLLSLSLFSFISAGSTKANENASVTFKWQANPENENVLGYRIYYGTDSRFNSDNSLKQNFYYNQLIDLTEMLKCYGPDFTICESIDSNQVQCLNLNAENPECTLSDLSGTPLYFAMTAYSNIAESQYTQELKWNNTSVVAIQEVVRSLLLTD